MPPQGPVLQHITTLLVEFTVKIFGDMSDAPTNPRLTLTHRASDESLVVFIGYIEEEDNGFLWAQLFFIDSTEYCDDNAECFVNVFH